MKILKKTSNWLAGEGILSCLTANYDVPWKSTILGQTLDDDYYGNRSGSKLISPLAEQFLDPVTDKLDTTAINRLARIIFSKYGANWNKAYEALNIEYNPIHNYDGSETYTESYSDSVVRDLDGTDGYTKTNTGTSGVSGTDTGTQTNATTNTGTQGNQKTIGGSITDNKTNTGTQGTTTTNTGTQTTGVTESGNESNADDVFGFNSSNAVHSNQNSGSDSRTSNTTRTDNLSENATRTDNLTEQNVKSYSNYTEQETRTDNLSENATRTDNLAHSETRTDNLSENNSGTRTEDETTTKSGEVTHTLERGGNYGMTTTQQMITEEMELRKLYNLFDCIVFPDVDKVMVLNNFEENGIYY